MERLTFDEFANKVDSLFPGLKFDGSFREATVGDTPCYNVSRADGLFCAYDWDTGWIYSAQDTIYGVCGFETLEEAIVAFKLVHAWKQGFDL